MTPAAAKGRRALHRIARGLRLAPPLLLSLTLGAGHLWAAKPADFPFVAPGRLVDIGGFALNLRCFGRGSPTVVFDAGLGDWSAVWATVQPSIARKTRACSYDRAGNGLSDAGPLPRTSARIVAELHTLLQRAGERAPFVLVGHSFGSMNVRLYADRYLREVAGLVLVDGSHEDQQALTDRAEVDRFARELTQCRTKAERRSRGAAKAWRVCAGLFFRGFPEKRLSPQLNAALATQALAPKQFLATLSELQNFGSTSSDEVRSAKRSFGNIPLCVLTATNHRDPSSKKSDAYWRSWETKWRALHETWLPLSTDSQEIIVSGSGHYIQFDRAALVSDSIADVVARARSRTRSEGVQLRTR